MQHTLYHSLLRITSVVVAFVLVFDSGLLSPATKELSRATQNYLANVVSVTATVNPNELNQITAELTKQKTALEEREQALEEREVAIARNSSGDSATNDYSTYILSTILFILLVLIVLNYGLDYARMRKLTEANA